MAKWIRPTLSAMAAALFLGSPTAIFAQSGAPMIFAQEELREEPRAATEAQIVEMEAEQEEEEEDCGWLNSFLLGDCLSHKTGLTISGWAAGGATFNDNFSTLNGPLSFNDRQDPLLNQLYFIVARGVDTDGCKLDLGFQVDVLYGSDAQFTQALGWDDNIISTNPDPTIGPVQRGGVFGTDSASGIYEMAIPQAYAEVFIPVGNGLTVKAGHFYTIIGYEVVTAPDNFFYSHAYTMQYGEPFTHTGILSSYDVNDMISLTGGITRGWDNYEDNNNAISFLGSATLNLGENTALIFALTTGSEQDEPRAAFQGIVAGPGQSVNRTMYSVVFDTTLFENLNYVFQHDHGVDEDIAGSGTGAEWYGINQYLLYEINDVWSAGMRAEWFRDDDGARVAGVRNGSVARGAAANYYGLTLGLQVKPTSCVLIRPEIRWDWQDIDSGIPAGGPNSRAFAGDTETTQFTGAVDVIVRF